MTTAAPPPATTSRRRPIGRIILGAWLAAIALIAGITVLTSGGDADPVDPATTDRVAAGPAAPIAPFENFDGTQSSLSAYEGRPLVVNFWASWCPSCVAELSAAFVPVQQQLGDDVAFLGLNLQDDRSRALDLVEQTGALFDLAEDPDGDLYAEFGGIGMPFTVFINEFGEVVHEHNGPVTEGQLTDLITENLLS